MLENFFIIIGLFSCLMGFLYVAIIMMETLIVRLYEAMTRILVRDREFHSEKEN